jgi:hypothetical protein
MKWIIRILVVLLVLVAALLWFAFSQMDRLVKTGIETATPPVVLTSVTLTSVMLTSVVLTSVMLTSMLLTSMVLTSVVLSAIENILKVYR